MPGSEVTPHEGHRLLPLPIWIGLYLGFALLGRATVIDDGALSLVWPAAGIAVLWLISNPKRHQPVDVTWLATCTFVVNFATGAPFWLALLFVLTNLLQAIAFIRLMSRLRPTMWGFGGSRTVDSLRDLGALLPAAAAACLIAATIGNAGIGLAGGDVDIATFAVWWGRNFAGQTLVTTLGVLSLQPWSVRTSKNDGVRRVRAAISAANGRTAAEMLCLYLLTVVVLAVVFVWGAHQPLAFVLLFTTVLAGVRLAPFAVAVHGCFTGAFAVGLTLAGRGPFADIESLHDRALVSQVFMVMCVITGLVLALNRAERDRALIDSSAAQRRAMERAALFDAVLQNMNEGIAVIRDDNAIEIRNPAGRKIMGIEAAPSTDMRQPIDYGLFHIDGRRLSSDEMPHLRVLRGEHVQAEDIMVRNRSLPEGRIIEVTATELTTLEPGPTSQHRRAVVNFRDVTVERRERDHLASFAGVVAHDLANPLTVIDGWVDTLNERHSDRTITHDEALHMIKRIQSASAHMSAFIKDLLAYTVATETTVTFTNLDLSAMADDVANLRRETDTQPSISIAPGLTAHGDQVLVRQLLDNIIGNAVKYVTPGVRPTIQITGHEDHEFIEVHVSDNGIGIPVEDRSRIFQDFERAHPADYRGTGLGLAICRRVVDRHGGSIWVNDNPGGGSIFAFTLPVARHAP